MALRIGTLGCANITPQALLTPAKLLDDVEVVAVAARDLGRAKVFARKHGIPRVHESYESLIQDSEIDAIYNPLPNALHAHWTIRALKAGNMYCVKNPWLPMLQRQSRCRKWQTRRVGF